MHMSAFDPKRTLGNFLLAPPLDRAIEAFLISSVFKRARNLRFRRTRVSSSALILASKG